MIPVKRAGTIIVALMLLTMMLGCALGGLAYSHRKTQDGSISNTLVITNVTIDSPPSVLRRQ